MRSQVGGMTMFELMITITLLGLLGAMAVPAYNGYTERARINRAIGDIGRVSIELYTWRVNSGGGSFPASLAVAGIDLAPDPWGNAYTYTRIEGAAINDLRKDRNLNPVNTDFDLFSNGPDGDSARPFTAGKSRDDVVRANDGGFIGIAEDY